MRPRARLAAALVALTAGLGLAACTGEESADDPAAALAQARSELDETSGVRLSMTTEELPDGVEGILKAEGVGTHAPAFEGTLTVVVNGLSLDVPVVAVDGEVYAQLPFTNRYRRVDPDDYGAPDPAALLAVDGGISSWLTEAADVVAGEQVRDGSQVLTSYVGTLPGAAVAAVIPSADASADFEVTFGLAEGRLAQAQVTGPFYGDADAVTYQVDLADYGLEPDITQP